MGFIKAGGLYKGVIVDTNDPSGKFNRVRVRIIKMHGLFRDSYESKNTTSNPSSVNIRNYNEDELPWCEVAFPFGSDFVPEVGQVVVVGFLGGDTSQPVVLGWMGYDYTNLEEPLKTK